MNILNSYRHIRPKKVKYPIPEIPDDSEKNWLWIGYCQKLSGWVGYRVPVRHCVSVFLDRYRAFIVAGNDKFSESYVQLLSDFDIESAFLRIIPGLGIFFSFVSLFIPMNV